MLTFNLRNNLLYYAWEELGDVFYITEPNDLGYASFCTLQKQVWKDILPTHIIAVAYPKVYPQPSNKSMDFLVITPEGILFKKKKLPGSLFVSFYSAKNDCFSKKTITFAEENNRKKYTFQSSYFDFLPISLFFEKAREEILYWNTLYPGSHSSICNGYKFPAIKRMPLDWYIEQNQKPKGDLFSRQPVNQHEEFAVLHFEITRKKAGEKLLREELRKIHCLDSIR